MSTLSQMKNSWMDLRHPEEESYNLKKHIEEASEAPQEEKNDRSNLGTAAPDVKMSEATQKVDVSDGTVALDLDDEPVQSTENTTDDTYMRS